MQFILMRQSRVKVKDKYTDLSSQPFDTIDPCTTVSVVLQLVNLHGTAENEEILAVLL